MSGARLHERSLYNLKVLKGAEIFVIFYFGERKSMFKRRCAMDRVYEFCINYSSVPFLIGAAAFYTGYYFCCVAKVRKLHCRVSKYAVT